jgi:phage gpG-like protein
MPDRVEIPKQPGWDQTFKSHTGPVGREIDRRATRVLAAARGQVGIRTGQLRGNIHKEWITQPGGDVGVRVGSNVPYALLHHEGTKPHIIRARRAKLLRYINRQGQVTFARSVFHPGTRSNKYLTDNLPLAGG